MTVQNISAKILPTLKRQGVIKAAIFGSFARGDSTAQSDIDVLVEFQDQKSLLDLVHIQGLLEKRLSKKVDLLTYKSINPLLQATILKDQQVIYEKRS